MHPLETKALLGALALPPASPLLLALLGLLLALRWRRTGVVLGVGGVGGLWLLSCNAVATLLAGALLPAMQPITPEQLRSVQGIVVLGGGVLPEAPEYGAPQPSAYTLSRLRYGAWLAKRTKLPLGFAGGVGWGAAGTASASEGVVVRRVAQEDYGLT